MSPSTSNSPTSVQDTTGDRQLIVRVGGGLCNRLRTYISGCYLASVSQRSLLLCWPTGGGCGARFEDLFCNPVEQARTLPDSVPTFDGSCPTPLWQAALSDQTTVCVDSIRWLVEPGQRDQTVSWFRYLKPAPFVTAAIEKMQRSLPEETAGVHARRGDFAKYLSVRYYRELPSLDKYFRNLEDWPGSIFLATDGGVEVEQAFRREFGERLIVYPKRRSGRDSSEAVQDALVDFYLLLACQKLVGTSRSSFTSLAAIVSRKPCVLIEGERLSPWRRIWNQFCSHTKADE